MNSNENYSHSPVTEALFDIQVELPQEITISDLEQLNHKIVSQYPKKRTRKRFESKFEIRDNQTPASESKDLGIDGFLNWSSDEKQVIQFRFDGYTFSRLKPYEKWDDYFLEVIKNWNLYQASLSPILIKRIAIRFINTIEIPFKSFDWGDYFVNPPKIPLESATLNNFFNRVEFSIPGNTKAIVTHSLTLSNHPLNTPVIFDIEVSKEIQSLLDEKTILVIFQGLRGIKNNIFEKSLTQKTKELFN